MSRHAHWTEIDPSNVGKERARKLMQASINGIRMTYAVAGPDRVPWVVLHHPLATNMTIWDELTSALAPTYRVLCFDACGHGRTEARKGIYNFHALASDVIALMDHLGIERAHFLGLSMGGMVGQYLGLTHGARFNTLVLASTSSRALLEAQPLWEERIKVASETGMASQSPGAIERWLTEANRENSAMVSRLRNMIEVTPLEGYLGWCGAIRNLNITHLLNAITLPTRIIVGADDPVTPVAASKAIHSEIKNSDLVVIPLVSHLPCMEDPETFHKHVRDFLEMHSTM